MKLKEAKKLCTRQEFYWIETAFTERLSAMSARELRDGVKRVRNLRNKFRDLEKTQRHEAKRREKGSADAEFFGDSPAARTTRKIELFVEALQRFEDALAVAEGNAPADEARPPMPERAAPRPTRVITTVKRKDNAGQRYGRS